MPRTHIDRSKVLLIFQGRKMQDHLTVKAEEAIAVAKGLYETRSHHLDRHVPDYQHSFFIKRGTTVTASGDIVPSRQIGNSSGRWWWVEFGAHAGGKTPVLHYRILGLTMDVLASRS